jgi:transcriptional regulator
VTEILYNPAAFRRDDPDLLASVVDAVGFGALICNGPDGPLASHLPLLLIRDAGRTLLRAHLARQNGHWRSLDGASVLVVFQGPDHYVSPGWYPSKGETGKVVPTWNYVVVHARGIARVWHDAARLRDLVAALTDRHERQRAEPWRVDDAPADYTATLLEHIVGVDVEVTGLEGKFKLGQNRTSADRAGVAAGLGAERPEVAAALEQLMAGDQPS